MSDDWQEAVFSNRHVHNRGQRGKVGKANSHGFNVQKTFGRYEIKSPKFPSTPQGDFKPAKMEIYTMNDRRNALLGELFIPGCLNANVLMAGSRKVMKRVVQDFVEKEDLQDSQLDEDGHASNEGVRPGDDDEDEDEDESQKAQEFEKNSFRSPKFWLKWQGQLLDDEIGDEIITDEGYIVFSGNACEKFDGTLSCEKLGWKNAKVSGWKIKGISARDFDIQWVAENKSES